MNIGLFGGAFDPFHNGHLAICQSAVKSAGLDRLIVIPTGNAPHKRGFAADFEDRYNMAILALEGTGSEVSRYEWDKGGVSYSADTVEDFHRMYPEDRLFFLIGADSYRDLHQWHEPWRITSLATLLVFPRGGMEVEVKPPAVMIPMEKIRISSTLIREALQKDAEMEKYLPAKVEKYIIEHNLYKN